MPAFAVCGDEGILATAVNNGKVVGAGDSDVNGTSNFMLARFDAG